MERVEESPTKMPRALNRRGAPVIRVVGPGRNVGKTSLASALIAVLSTRGLRVAAVKRSHHPLPSERPGSDTDCFARAGAAAVAFHALDGMLIRHGSRADVSTPSLAETLHALGDAHDLVIVEGFRDDAVGATICLDRAGTARFESEAGEELLVSVAADIVAFADAIERLYVLRLVS